MKTSKQPFTHTRWGWLAPSFLVVFLGLAFSYDGATISYTSLPTAKIRVALTGHPTYRDWNDELVEARRCQLSSQSFEKLKEDGVSAEVLKQLSAIENKEYSNRKALLKAAKKCIGDENMTTYTARIEQHIEGGIDPVYDVVPVDFKEYVKAVTAQEWNRALGKDETLDYIKTGAVAVKIFAWGMMNKKQGRHAMAGNPDVVDNPGDQLYVGSTCKQEDTTLCKKLTSNRLVSPISDQAVDETWDVILKRHDCYYEYGHPTNYGGTYKEKCPYVFETKYNQTEGGCKTGDLWAPHSCIPQIEGRSRMEQDQLTWTDMLAYYYGLHPAYPTLQDLRETLKTAPMSLYEWKADDLAVNSTVETLNTCMTILYELNGNEKIPQYGCKNRDDIVIKKIHYLKENGFPHPCQDEKDACPLDDHYIDVGTKGILLEVKANARQETWFKVQWKLYPGSNASDAQFESKNVIVGWSPDTDIKPADAMSLVEVKIIGARLKAHV